MQRTIIGIDCAVSPENVGCALAEMDGKRCEVIDLKACSQSGGPADVVTGWLRSCRHPALIALDAPLGWPRALGGMLGDHRAGAAPRDDAHTLFRRATDDFVHATVGKRPLDVGADRIARTAHAALDLLGDVRGRLDAPIPLAWTSEFTSPAAIEVYPAATLRAHGMSSTQYRHAGEGVRRLEILREVRKKIDVPRAYDDAVERSADVLDAVVCVLAARDFLTARSIPPTDMRLARKEGWIWFRDPAC